MTATMTKHTAHDPLPRNEIVMELRELQAQRIAALTARLRIDQQTWALFRRYLGYDQEAHLRLFAQYWLRTC